MSIYNDASLIYYPSGYKASKAYSLKPTDGSGDLTFTRASTATRVNAEGLIETASVLGAELVTNGDFATDTDWILENGAEINGGSANLLGYNSRFMQLRLVSGKKYKLHYTVISTDGGSFRFQDGVTAYFNINQTVGTHIYYFTATGNRVQFQATSAIDARIDNVSVKEVITNNVPRIDYTGGGCGKLLLEPQRTNLIPYSEDFSNDFWSKTSVTVTTSTIVSPDGLQGSYKLIPDNGTGGNRSISNSYTSLTGLHTHTCFAKKGEYDYLMLRTRNSISAGVMFDLANGTLSVNLTSPVYVSSKIENYGNGWYRCSITLDPSQAGTVGQLFISMSVGITGSEGNSFNGDGTSGVYIWGAQLEAGSYPTSYIPTTSTAVTRVADSASKTPISSFLNTANPFTFYLNFERPDAIQASAGYQMIGLDNGGYGQRIKLINRGNQKQFAIEVYNGVTSTQTSPITNTPNIKVAIVYDGSTSYKVFHNGVLFQTLTNAATTLTRLISGENGTNYTKENYQSIMIFPTALSDAECIALTTL